MDPDLAEPLMKDLDATGVGLANAWRNVPADTLAGEAAIGVDKLGWAFREGLSGGQAASDLGNGYIQFAHSARESAQQLPVKYQDLAAAGLASARDYRDADQRGAGAMPR
ncbi:hypothetical protein [Saccharothrix hoggarensis]|uniref:Excreted virulence factor EspC (Type VII ESX diderm) n=1 Tax=Saccharothrix hoggarensis TaxID=913853 RepID=A0ABW3R3V9_9PSEU